MHGAIRLLASLFKSKDIGKGNIVDCVNRLVRLDGEMRIVCIYELLRLIGKDFDESVKTSKDKQTWWANLFDTLKIIEKKPKATPRVRSMINEILEAKEGNFIFPDENEDERFHTELHAILETLPTGLEGNIGQIFAMVSARLRKLVPTIERHPYLVTEIIEALLGKCRFYHNEILGSGKMIIHTEQFARMQIENGIMSKQKQNFNEALKAKDEKIAELEKQLKMSEGENVKLSREINIKDEAIEHQMLNEANYRTTIQQAFDAKVDEFRKQLAIQLQAYIGNNNNDQQTGR